MSSSYISRAFLKSNKLVLMYLLQLEEYTPSNSVSNRQLERFLLSLEDYSLSVSHLHSNRRKFSFSLQDSLIELTGHIDYPVIAARQKYVCQTNDGEVFAITILTDAHEENNFNDSEIIRLEFGRSIDTGFANYSIVFSVQ